MINSEQIKDDITFLLSFVPAQDPDDVVPGLCRTFYVTGNYEGDVKIARKIQEIKDRYAITHEAGIEESIT